MLPAFTKQKHWLWTGMLGVGRFAGLYGPLGTRQSDGDDDDDDDDDDD